MNFETLFQLGMKRDIGSVPPPPDGVWLELGPGKNPVPGARGLEWPEWRAERDPLPGPDGGVAAIFALHFFEHLSGTDAIGVLRECELVLQDGGLLYIVVPHRLSQLATEDLDHKSFWCEETWKTLFRTDYYAKHRDRPWSFDIVFNLVAGVNERNLALFTVLRRKPRNEPK